MGGIPKGGGAAVGGGAPIIGGGIPGGTACGITGGVVVEDRLVCKGVSVPKKITKIIIF